MTADHASDIALLLTPISAEQPSGSDMSFSSELDAIQEARRADDASLDQGEWVTALKEADWAKSLQITSALLTGQTKDLRLASWYTEASAKVSGIGGMTRGFTLITGLLEQFWDSLHPLPDGADMEQRIGNLSWLIARCVQLTRELPLVKNAAQPYGIQELEAARAHQQQLERSPDSATPPRVSLQQFKAAQRATPRTFHEQLLQACSESVQALDKLAEVTDQRLGLDGPSFTPLKSALETYSDAVQRIARENGVIESSPEDQAEAEAADAPAEASASNDERETTRANGPLRSRAQALQQLRQVADFFRRTEPHSPVAYLADKAAKWGEMPLHVWLRSVMKDDSAIARFEDLLGFESSGNDS
jgi:type VI secretion system protein ImpA